MSQMPPDPDTEGDVDFDELALEQIEKGEPDELDGPAWDLDRPLDGRDDE